MKLVVDDDQWLVLCHLALAYPRWGNWPPKILLHGLKKRRPYMTIRDLMKVLESLHFRGLVTASRFNRWKLTSSGAVYYATTLVYADRSIRSKEDH